VVVERKMLENVFDVIGVFLEHLLEHRRKPGTIRSLKVVEHRNGNRRIGQSLEWRL
jgi:hypothetical protein